MAFWNNEIACYTSITKYNAISVWATGTAAAGDLCRQTAPSAGNERIFCCIIGGAKSGSEPTWVISPRGSKTVDTSATWIEITGWAAVNGDNSAASGINWNAVKGLQMNQGMVINDVAGTHVFVLTTAGTAGGGAEPTWNVAAIGNTTADNTCTWTYIGLQSSFTKFKCAHARLSIPWNTSYYNNSMNAGNPPQRFYVGSDHTGTTETNGTGLANIGTNQTPVDLICCNVAGNVPPNTSSDLATGGSFTTGGNFTSTISGAIRWCYGMTFSDGNGSSGNPNLVIQGQGGVDSFFESCNFIITGNAGSSELIFNNGSNPGVNRLKNCVFKLGSTGNSVQASGRTIFDNCTIDGTGSIPTILFNPYNGGAETYWKNSDLSNVNTQLSGGVNGHYPVRTEFIDCKLNASATFDARTGSAANEASSADHLILTRCSTGANNYQFSMSCVAGKMDADAVIYRNGGAVDNTTPFGWTLNTSTTNPARIHWGQPFEFPPVAFYNTKINQNRTATFYGIINAAALPTNQELYFDWDYLGSASSTLGTIATSRAASNLAGDVANLTADTSGWDAGVTARQNTHTYQVGDVIKVASNPGRIFYCTVGAANSAGSEPGGYASAVDGGVVTDGSCTFRAGVRFKMSITVSSPQPAIVGNMFFTIKYTKGSQTLTIDPGVVMS